MSHADSDVASTDSDVASTDSDVASATSEELKTLNLENQLSRSFQNGQSGMVFACGGKVPIPIANDTTRGSSTTGDVDTTCQPVVLRWDPQSQDVLARVCKLQFPLDCSENATVNNLQQLFEDMQPATFGYQGQDVLDESYRKASKLDPSHFDCTFNPYEMGIIDEVAQILLPGVKRETTSNNNGNSSITPGTEGINVIRAELYKLNVYSGPSGHFKAHVDTPRSNEQIGSLVVCLPSTHQGGQLEVRHQGQSMMFDWSMPENARPEIQWAAFYSDCEHEVMEVTSGHRITLTYNLYARNISTENAPRAGRGLMDPTQLPQYGILHSLLLQENYMPDGGLLGVHTSHAYPHTSDSACLPATLKGADMVVWETFRALGCVVKLRPVVKLEKSIYYGPDSEDEESDSDDSDYEIRQNTAAGSLILGNNLRFRNDCWSLVECDKDMRCLLNEWTEEDPREPTGPTTQPARVFYEDVAWLNYPGRNEEPQISFMTYGNDALPEMMYSTCSMVAMVPPYTTRKSMLG